MGYYSGPYSGLMISASTCDSSLFSSSDSFYNEPPHMPSRFAEYKPSPQSKYCYYCGGDTYNDDKGHCAACGAPRIKPPKQHQGGKVRTKSHIEPDIETWDDDDDYYEDEDE